ncbi:MAG TPA: NYN domain-containing protein [Abditibacterium sp.]|jgi:uncharacterized LabA/DUF88 family protein
MQSPPFSSSPSRFAAVFLDFENVYYFLKNHFYDPPNLNDHILEMLRNLRASLSEKLELDCIVLNAYADFERLGSTPQGALYLLGVDTKNVMGTDHKNAADMKMCIDVLEVLYTRPEIGTFVLVAGDRDYIPVIQHLRRQARRVLGVGFRESVSGDLLLNLGEGQFLDARDLLDAATLESLEKRRREQQELAAQAQLRIEEQAREIDARVRAAQAQSAPEVVAPLKPNAAPEAELFDDDEEFAPIHRIRDEDECQCLTILLEKLHRLQQTRTDVKELWLGPILRHLADEMPALAEFERRRVLDGLTRAGAIQVVKRQGDAYPYSVVLVNYQHPDVWELNPG